MISSSVKLPLMTNIGGDGIVDHCQDDDLIIEDQRHTLADHPLRIFSHPVSRRLRQRHRKSRASRWIDGRSGLLDVGGLQVPTIDHPLLLSLAGYGTCEAPAWFPESTTLAKEMLDSG